MALDCEVVLRWDATPAQRRALGNSLWEWCIRAGGDRIYQFLDNQALADLAAGRLPSSGKQPRDARMPYIYFTVPGHTAQDRSAALEELRLTIASQGIADVRVGGVSWCVAKSDKSPSLPGIGAPSVPTFADALPVG